MIDIINQNLPLPPVTIGALNDERRFPDRRYLNPELKEMFFALNLIESYGSGIRRAKDAMLANGSPPLSFKPTDEESDYTMVTMPINEEFASMRDSEAGIGATSRGTDKETAATGKETDKETAATGKETDKETAATGKETDDTDKEICDTGKETSNIRDRMVLMLTQDPGLTLRDMAERLGLSMSGVRYHMGILRRNHIVYREGSTKSGRWVVVDKGEEDAEG